MAGRAAGPVQGDRSRPPSAIRGRPATVVLVRPERGEHATAMRHQACESTKWRLRAERRPIPLKDPVSDRTPLPACFKGPPDSINYSHLLQSGEPKTNQLKKNTQQPSTRLSNKYCFLDSHSHSLNALASKWISLAQLVFNSLEAHTRLCTFQLAVLDFTRLPVKQ